MSAFTTTGPSSFYPTLSNPYTDHLREGTTGSNWTSTVGIPGPGTGCYPYDTTGLYNPYSDSRYSGMDSAARRKNATRETTNTLKAWLYEHRKNPYPTKGEKIMLAIITKMTLTQVSTWFANARRRLKKENKMTWEPRNKTSDGSGHGDMDDRSLDGESTDGGGQDDLSNSTTSHRGTSTGHGMTAIDHHRTVSSPHNNSSGGHHQDTGINSHHHHHHHHGHSRSGARGGEGSPILDVKCESISNSDSDGKQRHSLTPLKGPNLGSDATGPINHSDRPLMFDDHHRLTSARLEMMSNGHHHHHIPPPSAGAAHFAAAAAAEYHSQQSHHQRFLNQFTAAAAHHHHHSVHHPVHHPVSQFSTSPYFSMSPSEVAAAAVHHHHHSVHPHSMLHMLSNSSNSTPTLAPLPPAVSSPLSKVTEVSRTTPPSSSGSPSSTHHLLPLQSVQRSNGILSNQRSMNGMESIQESLTGTDSGTADPSHVSTNHSIDPRTSLTQRLFFL